MLPPAMGYEVGKGREYELEQKAAKNRLLDEALEAKRLQWRGLFARISAFLARARQGKWVQLPAGREGEREEQFRGRFVG